MEKKEKIIIGLCVIAAIIAGVLHYTEANAVLSFAVTAVALALLAMIVGDATEQLGSRMGPAMTGILQSAPDWQMSSKPRWSARFSAILCLFSDSQFFSAD